MIAGKSWDHTHINIGLQVIQAYFLKSPITARHNTADSSMDFNAGAWLHLKVYGKKTFSGSFTGYRVIETER